MSFKVHRSKRAMRAHSSKLSHALISKVPLSRSPKRRKTCWLIKTILCLTIRSRLCKTSLCKCKLRRKLSLVPPHSRSNCSSKRRVPSVSAPPVARDRSGRFNLHRQTTSSLTKRKHFCSSKPPQLSPPQRAARILRLFRLLSRRNRMALRTSTRE